MVYTISSIQELVGYLDDRPLKGAVLSNVELKGFSFDDLFSCIASHNERARYKISSYQDCHFYLTETPILKPTKDIKFENCSFDGSYDFQNLSTGISSLITFNNCCFCKDITLSNFRAGEMGRRYSSVDFCECQFKDTTLTISDVRIGNELPLLINIKNNNSTKLNRVVIANMDSAEIQTQNIDIDILQIKNVKNTEKHKGICIDSINVSVLRVMQMSDSVVEKSLYLYDTCRYAFSRILFISKVVRFDQKNTINKPKSIKANYCKFNDIVRLNRSTRKAVQFSNCEFNEQLWLVDTNVEKIYFQNCDFNATTKIVNSENEIKWVDFSRSTISGLFLFNGWSGDRLRFTPDAAINFTHLYVQPNGYLIVRDINEDNSKNGSFDFSYSNILGTITFTNVVAKSLNLEGAAIVGNFLIGNPNIASYANSQTSVRLKNEAIKQNDSISAMRYKADEMKKHRKELYKDIGKTIKHIILRLKPRSNESIKSWRELKRGANKIAEYILLRFNSFSNKNGQSWWRGVQFTCFCAWVFFVLINCVGLNGSTFFEWKWYGWDSFGEVWKSYLKVLNLVDFSDKFEHFSFNAWGQTLLFTSKIFVGYGIYQTISAFRKYGK